MVDAEERSPVAWRPILGITAIVAAAHAVIAVRYGWHRDEFYYVESGHHLAWGYPDQPPLTPLLARLADELPGDLLPLRLFTIAFQSGTIILGGLIGHELGGGRRAQSLAAGCAAGCGVFVGGALFLGTVPVDQFLWAAILLLALRAVRIGSIVSWVPVGVIAGIGLENKHTVAILLAGMFVGLLVRKRSALASAGPWIAALIALVLWAPNLIWDARNDWITFDMADAIADDQGGIGGSLAQLPILLFLLPAPPLIFMWMRGVRWTWRSDEGRQHAWLVVTTVFVIVATVLAGGKPYYPAPLLVALFAFGAIATERREIETGNRLRWTTGLVVSAVVVSPFVSLPMLTPAVSTALRGASREPMETYGWPDLAAQVDDVVEEYPDVVAVYAGNYGEAGALSHFGQISGQEVPVVSAHNAYGSWGPPTGTPTEVIAVGQFGREHLERSWGSVEKVGTFELPDDLENQETEEDAAFFRCREPRGSWADLWPELSHLS